MESVCLCPKVIPLSCYLWEYNGYVSFQLQQRNEKNNFDKYLTALISVHTKRKFNKLKHRKTIFYFKWRRNEKQSICFLFKWYLKENKTPTYLFSIYIKTERKWTIFRNVFFLNDDCMKVGMEKIMFSLQPNDCGFTFTVQMQIFVLHKMFLFFVWRSF